VLASAHRAPCAPIADTGGGTGGAKQAGDTVTVQLEQRLDD
jgi:hypothetical protein